MVDAKAPPRTITKPVPPKPDKLDVVDVVDELDVSPRMAKPDLTGKRVRAIPGRGGTTVLIRRKDFAELGVEHPDVTWDFRIDDFTVPVGPLLSEEAANILVEKVPIQFEFVNKE